MRLILLLVIVQQIFADPAPLQLNGEQFSSGINHFSVEVTKTLDYANDNIVYSPFGLSMIWGMLLRGAQGDTRDSLFRMMNMLQYENKDDIHKLFKKITDRYKVMANSEKNPKSAIVELNNLLVTMENCSLPEKFVEAVKESYQAYVGKENFNNGSYVKEKLNKFVKEGTHGLIPQAFAEPIDPSTIAILLNTIYFKGFWMDKFDSNLVYKSTFYNSDKSESLVDMMRRNSTYYKYKHSNNLKSSLLEMPYDGGFSMIIVLPDEANGLKDLIKNLKNEEFEAAIKNMTYNWVEVEFPKLNYEHSVDLLAKLHKMSVNIIPALTPLDPTLLISSAFHKATIQVHESGTEAAAVSVFSFSRTNAITPENTIRYKCDRPFMFVIRDSKTNCNLFFGVVNKL